MPATSTAAASSFRSFASPWLIWSIARPVSAGIATVIAIAAVARTSDSTTPRR